MAYVDSPFDTTRQRPARTGAYGNPFKPGQGFGTFSANGSAPQSVFVDNSQEGIDKLNHDHPEYGGGASEPPKAPTYYGMAGYDQGKLNDLTHKSAKYQIGRTLRGFDPHLGVSSDVLAALNKLGFGTFAGSRDDLSLSGVTDAGRAAGLDPHDFSGDFIQGFHSNNPLWQYDFYKDPAAVQQAAYGPDPMAAYGQDPMANLPFQYAQMMGAMQPQAQPVAPQPQLPAIFSDPSFWQQMMGAMQPQAPSSMPNFNGAQAGTGKTQPSGMNPQITQLLSQLFAGISGGR